MSQPDTRVVKLPPGAEGYLRSNRHIARRLYDLLHADDHWSRVDLPMDHREIHRCRRYSILTPAGTDQYRDNGGTLRTRPTYAVTAAARRWVEKYGQPDQGPWPRCGHTGLVNHGNGNYGCGDPGCEERYSRTEAEAVTIR